MKSTPITRQMKNLADVPSSKEDYNKQIQRQAEEVFKIMSSRCSLKQLRNIKSAFELAKEAHHDQKRKTGEPYILHPIAVAKIVASEMQLGPDAVMAAFLHDVVEDTHFTLEDIKNRFGENVAFLVGVVTKQKKEKYDYSKQVDNYRQMLESLQTDVRALLIKLADRLHNMRTLSSMPPAKQMKIAGETDYFYAPLANRLGLYNIKTELENLSFRFRCPHEYEEMVKLIAEDERQQHSRLKRFTKKIESILSQNGVKATVRVIYRQPYSLWRKMHKYGDDFNHLKYRHFTEIEFSTPDGVSDKEMALRIYSLLTNHFNEKPGGISNYIDTPKENGYQSFHVKLLADFGRWQEVHISSHRMIIDSYLGCANGRSEGMIKKWIEKFRTLLDDIALRSKQDGSNFIENVVTSFYNDDIMTFTPDGKEMILPQKATALDFAYEVKKELGENAKYARVNGFLTSIKSQLRRGDVVEIFTDPQCHPEPDWLDSVVTYKAKKAISNYLDSQPIPMYHVCPICNPIPGEEVIGFKDKTGRITLHKRDCATAIRLASQFGDNIVSVNYEADDTVYPVTMIVRAVDRYHLLLDLVDCISNQLHLTMDSINTATTDSIVTCTISFSVHSADELQEIIHHIAAIPGVDEVKRQ